ncbi:hypothetical protein [Rubripirellula reticaptiva]|uniref:Uncharacterized protein n=1 Tax=Rubripirellula reticaptiva TaxID=2528013 RepID=A0A5C6ERQ6_9BACT|nr:hypothetical protein [Rubripirellula reticaptiva]TWU51638.1 hypothetical protein Poly59_32320 [Rubripirellula reticaptiva]
MNLRAVPESNFLLKFLLISLGLLGFAALSAYDGFVKYPKGYPRLHAWEKLKEEVASSPGLDDEDLKERWEEIAQREGYSKRRPSSDESSEALDGKIFDQYIFLVLGILIGLPMLAKYFMDKESWIESTEDSLKNSSGVEMKISQITQFNKAKWEKKGIGVFHYKTDDGIARKFVVDDLKYNRDNTDRIVEWVESQIPREMIVGGEPEQVSKVAEANVESDDAADGDESNDLPS